MASNDLEAQMKETLDMDNTVIDMDGAKKFYQTNVSDMPGEIFNGEMSKIVALLSSHDAKNLSSLGPQFLRALDYHTRERAQQLRDSAYEMRKEAQRRELLADTFDEASAKLLTMINDTVKTDLQLREILDSVPAFAPKQDLSSGT